MVYKSINPLQLWNMSKQVASTAYDVHAGAVTFKQFTNTHESYFIPFDDETDIEHVVNTVEDSTREAIVEALQRHVHETVKQNATLTNTDLNTNLSGLQLSNRARTAAKQLLNHVEESDVEHNSTMENTDAYESLLGAHDEFLPTSETEAFTLIQSLQGDNRRDKFNELTSELITIVRSRQDTSETVTSGGSDSSQSNPQIRLIAEDLATLFIDRDYTAHDSYADITTTYDDVVFPSRDVTMMKVVNATGKTREERVNSIVDWVTEWFMNPEHAQELSTRRRAPMGMRTTGRSD